MNILHTVQEIMRDLFDDDTLVVNLTTSAEDIEEWDSLSNMNLIVEIEHRYDIQFSVQDLESMQSVGNIIKLIEKKS
jgi:acyl carrier protein